MSTENIEKIIENYLNGFVKHADLTDAFIEKNKREWTLGDLIIYYNQDPSGNCLITVELDARTKKFKEWINYTKNFCKENSFSCDIKERYAQENNIAKDYANGFVRFLGQKHKEFSKKLIVVEKENDYYSVCEKTAKTSKEILEILIGWGLENNEKIFATLYDKSIKKWWNEYNKQFCNKFNVTFEAQTVVDSDSKLAPKYPQAIISINSPKTLDKYVAEIFIGVLD